MSTRVYYASIINPQTKGTPVQRDATAGGNRRGGVPCNCRHGLRGSGK